MTKRLVPLVLALTLTLASCGGDDKTAASTPTSSPAPALAPSAPRQYTLADARRALLTLKDLEAGYEKYRPDEAPWSTNCGEKPLRKPPTVAGSSFRQSETGPFVDSNVALFPDPAGAERYRKQMVGPGTCKFTDDEGAKVSIKSLGNGSYYLTASGFGTIYGLLTIHRHENALVLVLDVQFLVAVKEGDHARHVKLVEARLRG